MEKRNELYKKVGGALHLCQVLELHIRILISILNDKFGSSLEQDGLILTEDKNTLGKLISELKKYASLDENGSKILAKALEKRNYISHHFFNKNIYAFSNDEIFNETIENLATDTNTIATAVAMVQGFVEAFCKTFKIDMREILVEQSSKKNN